MQVSLADCLSYGLRTLWAGQRAACLHDVLRLYTDLDFCLNVVRDVEDIAVCAWWVVFYTRPASFQYSVRDNLAGCIGYLEQTRGDDHKRDKLCLYREKRWSF
jgi:hypothetical protein